MDNDKINNAAGRILTACLEADDAVACLHAEIDRLRFTSQWTNLELRRLQEILLDQARQIARERTNEDVGPTSAK
jgi:hypothetical protein